jgi:hypothetical protein
MRSLQQTATNPDLACSQYLCIATDEGNPSMSERVGLDSIIPSRWRGIARLETLRLSRRLRIPACQVLSTPCFIWRTKNGLRWKVCPIGAFSTQALTFYKGHPHLGVIQATRAGFSGDAGTDDDGIKFFAHGFVPSPEVPVFRPRRGVARDALESSRRHFGRERSIEHRQLQRARPNINPQQHES